MKAKRKPRCKRVASDDGLERALRKMFSAGESWALTYSTWFEPTKEDTEQRVRKSIKFAKRFLRSNAKVSSAHDKA